ncbi:MAG TPA: hypothetical protein VJS64_13115 [Pyrinomonadaceae bacterium]|nr:hypothetical protein [Pyrinomonadaceae bacterium]
MTTKVRRPLTVWLTQALLLVFALIWFLSLTINSLMFIVAEPRPPLWRAIIGFSIVAGIVVVLVAGFWGLTRRRRYGKWLGLISLVFLWIIFLLIQLRPPQGPFQRYTYDSPAQVAGAVIAGFVISALFLTVILRLAFSKKVNEFFERDETGSG